MAMAMPNTTLIQVPEDLAYVIEKCHGSHLLHTEKNLINAVGVQNIDAPLVEKLPDFIDDYTIKKCPLLKNVVFGHKTTPLTAPILKEFFNSLHKETNNAVVISKLILKFLYDKHLTPIQEFLIGNYIIQQALQSSLLKDELFVQLLSQSVGISDPSATERLWSLISAVISCCLPSDNLYLYVLKYVSDEAPESFRTVCQHQMLTAYAVNLHTFDYDAEQTWLRVDRLFPASTLEWKSSKKKGLLALCVRSYAGHEKVIAVNNFTSGEVLASQFIKALQLQVPDVEGGWSICLRQYGNDKLIEIGGHGYIFDLLCSIELPLHWQEAIGEEPDKVLLLSTAESKINVAPSSSGVTESQFQDDQRSPNDLTKSHLERWLENVVTSVGSDDGDVSQYNVRSRLKGPPTSANGRPYQPPYSGIPSAQGAYGYAPASTTVNPELAHLQQTLQSQQLQNAILQESLQGEYLRGQIQQLQRHHSKYEHPTVPVAENNRPAVSGPPRKKVPEPPENKVSFSTQVDKIPRVEYQSELNQRDSLTNSDSPKQMSPPLRTQAATEKPHTNGVNRKDSANYQAYLEKAKTVRVGKIKWPPRKEDVEKEIKRPSKLLIDEDTKDEISNTIQMRHKPAPVQNNSQHKSNTPQPAQDTTDNVIEDEPEKRKVKLRRSYIRAQEIPKINFKARLQSLEDNLVLKVEDEKPKIKSTKAPVKINVPQLPPLPPPPPMNAHAHAQSSIPPPPQPPLQLPTQPPLQLPPQPQSVTPKQVVTDKKSQFLSTNGLPYFMYTMVPWSLVLRKELFFPGEKTPAPLLIDQIFTQIVSDVFSVPPSIRLQHNGEVLKSLLANSNVRSKDFDASKVQMAIKKKTIQLAKTFPYYFARFYPVVVSEEQFPQSTVLPTWLVVSHLGVRLVEFDNGELFERSLFNFKSINKVKSQKEQLVLETTNDVFNIQCHFSKNAESLIKIMMKRPAYAEEPIQVEEQFNSKPHNIESPRPLYQQVQKELIIEQIVDEKNWMILETYASKHYQEALDKHLTSEKCKSLVTWRHSPLLKSLHFMPPEMERIAVAAFYDVLKFCGDYAQDRNKEKSYYVANLLHTCEQYPDLVDEICCYTIMQGNNNRSKSKESLFLCWRLLHILTCHALPSQSLKYTMFQYLQHLVDIKEKHFGGDLPKLCLTNLQRIEKLGPRQNFHLDEIKALTLGYTSKRVVCYLPGELNYAVTASPLTLVSEACEEVLQTLRVYSEIERCEFVMYITSVEENISIPLVNETYLFDNIANFKTNSCSLYLRRQIWITPMNLQDRNDNYIQAMFYQIYQEYHLGHWIQTYNRQLTEKQIADITLLGALAHVIMFPKLNISLKTTREVIPLNTETKTNLNPGQWVQMVSQQMQQLRFSVPQCRKLFVETVSRWFMFGTTQFDVHMVTGDNGGHMPNTDFILSLNKNGIQLLNIDTNDEVVGVTFKEVLSMHQVKDSQNRAGLLLETNSPNGNLFLLAKQSIKIMHIIEKYKQLLDN